MSVDEQCRRTHSSVSISQSSANSQLITQIARGTTTSVQEHRSGAFAASSVANGVPTAGQSSAVLWMLAAETPASVKMNARAPLTLQNSQQH